MIKEGKSEEIFISINLSSSEITLSMTSSDRRPLFLSNLHECVAFLNKWSVGDLLEVLADVWQRLGLLDQSLIVVDQCQGYTEQDFRALVEQAVPNPQDRLQKNNNKEVNPTRVAMHNKDCNNKLRCRIFYISVTKYMDIFEHC